MQVLFTHSFMQICTGCTPSNSLMNVTLGYMSSFLLIGIVIWCQRISSLHARIEKCPIERLISAAGFYLHRAGFTTIFVAPAPLVEGFHLLEIREAVGITPSAKTHLFPIV